MLVKTLTLLLSLSVLTSPALSSSNDDLHRRTATSRCTPGTYSANGNAPCRSCPAGSFSRENGVTTCTKARPGYYVASTGARDETPCRAGTYQAAAGATKCDSCPPGYMCPSNAMHTPQQCSPGRYSTGGVANCPLCAPGTFNNIHKATGCCKCAPGWFLAHGGNVNCQQCPREKPYSDPGSTSMDKCSSKIGLYSPSATSNQGSNGQCPPANPAPSGHPKRFFTPRSNCKYNQRACPVYNNDHIIDYDCVDVKTDLVSCGGCVTYSENGALSPDGGRDCSAIPFVDEVLCNNGRCQISSCAPGYTLSARKDGCIPLFQLNTGMMN